MKRSLSAAFSTKALSEQEDIVQSCVDEFIDKIEGIGTAKEGIDMTQWYEMIAFDILGAMAFGEPFHSVRTGKA